MRVMPFGRYWGRMKSPWAAFILAHGILPLPLPSAIPEICISDQLALGKYLSHTVHLIQELADEQLLVSETLAIDHFPAQQNGIALVVYWQLYNLRLLFPSISDAITRLHP